LPSEPPLPLFQTISARIGRVTGHGLAANIRDHYPPWLLHGVVSLLVVANVLNIAADLGAMGGALEMVAGGPSQLYIVFFALLSLTLQIFVPFPRYAPILKWLTASLLGYVATVLVVSIGEATIAAFVPHVQWRSEYLSTLVAVLGTTISPYLFFWQASQEVEEQRAAPGDEPLREAPDQAIKHLARIKFDTWIGMVFSNLIAACIIVTTAATLNAHGMNVDSAEQAARRCHRRQLAFLLSPRASSEPGSSRCPCSRFRGLRREARRWPTGSGSDAQLLRGARGCDPHRRGTRFLRMDPIRMLPKAA
jgi:Mn2+/Fe2+ NRAMP family transporter